MPGGSRRLNQRFGDRREKAVTTIANTQQRRASPAVCPVQRRCQTQMLPDCNKAAVEQQNRCATSIAMQTKVLVVEDDADILELISFKLKEAGYAVATATDGLQAVNQARSTSPDLILLDLMLPEFDGFTVCEILRRDSATAAVPIIMLSGWGSESSRIIGLESGADDYVTKPFSPQELLLRVKRLLRREQNKPEAEITGSGSTG